MGLPRPDKSGLAMTYSVSLRGTVVPKQSRWGSNEIATHLSGARNDSGGREGARNDMGGSHSCQKYGQNFVAGLSGMVSPGFAKSQKSAVTIW